MSFDIKPATKWETMCLSCSTRMPSALRRIDIVNDTTRQQVWGACVCVDCLRDALGKVSA